MAVVKSVSTTVLARILALASLFMGLGDAAGVLGVAGPDPRLVGGSFALLVILSIMRLFSAVGLWIGVQWGAVVLLGALVIEIGLSMAGSTWVSLSLWGFIFKLATMLATIGLLALELVEARRQRTE